MIQAVEVSKNFDGFEALKSVSATISAGSVYGLVGSNGAGKSTLLRLISGIYKCDHGSILVNGENVYENIAAKKKIAFLSDEPYFFDHHTINDMAKFYSSVYPDFNSGKLEKLRRYFPLDLNKKIRSFSKGMKRQAAVMLSLCCMPEIILMDETFDGLDPIMRQNLKNIIIEEMNDRNICTVISSHNLRELEDVCDYVGLLHKGGIMFERNLEELKSDIFKIQTVLKTKPEREFFVKAGALHYEERASIVSVILKNNKDEIAKLLAPYEPLFLDIIPLTLEEVFIYEMEVVGYDVGQIL